MDNLPEELKKQIPDKPKEDVEEGVKLVDDKIHEMENLMKDKVDQLDNIMNLLESKNIDESIATTVGNVREILSDKSKENKSK